MKNWKRWFGLCLVVWMLFCIQPMTAQAAEELGMETAASLDMDGVIPTIVASGTCGADVTWVLDTEGTLLISGNGDMYSYHSSGSPWLNWSNSIRKVVIEEGVTSVGGMAFYGCEQLTEVVLPDGLAAVGRYAFFGCSNLQQINLPESITTIEEDAFAGCTALERVSGASYTADIEVAADAFPEETIVADKKEPAGAFYYGRSSLAEMPNAAVLLYAYDAIVAGVDNLDAEIAIGDGIYGLSSAEVELVMEAYTSDHAEHFWLGNTYSYTTDGQMLMPLYLLSGNALLNAQTAFEDAVAEILSGLRTDWSDFEKELYLHDALAERVEYTEGINAHNAYGALVEGKVVCEGYAEAFQVLLHRAGIQSYIVIGSSRGENHAWNLVCIDDEYYYVDLTWDDQGSELFHAYFNIPEAVLTEDHVIESAIVLPACDSEEANYFTVMGGRLTAFDGQAIGEILKENNLTAHLYMDGGLTVDGFVQELSQPSNQHIIMGAAGISGRVSMQVAYLGREVVLRVIPAGLSAEIKFVSTKAVTLTVRGLFDSAVSADLFIAVYDADGRMIGIEHTVMHEMSANGSDHSVFFEGTPNTVRVFALDEVAVPYCTAVMLNVK